MIEPKDEDWLQGDYKDNQTVIDLFRDRDLIKSGDMSFCDRVNRFDVPEPLQPYVEDCVGFESLQWARVINRVCRCGKVTGTITDPTTKALLSAMSMTDDDYIQQTLLIVQPYQMYILESTLTTCKYYDKQMHTIVFVSLSADKPISMHAVMSSADKWISERSTKDTVCVRTDYIRNGFMKDLTLDYEENLNGIKLYCEVSGVAYYGDVCIIKAEDISELHNVLLNGRMKYIAVHQFVTSEMRLALSNDSNIRDVLFALVYAYSLLEYKIEQQLIAAYFFEHMKISTKEDALSVVNKLEICEADPTNKLYILLKEALRGEWFR